MKQYKFNRSAYEKFIADELEIESYDSKNTNDCLWVQQLLDRGEIFSSDEFKAGKCNNEEGVVRDNMTGNEYGIAIEWCVEVDNVIK